MIKRIPIMLMILIFTTMLLAQSSVKFHVDNLRSSDMVTGSWMYDFDDPGLPTHDGSAFTYKPTPTTSHLNAFRYLEWCGLTTQSLVSENLSFVSGTDVVTVQLETFELTGFQHINTVNPDNAWNTYGQAGDRRDYTGGIIHVYVNGIEKMRLNDCRIVSINPYQTAAQIRVILTALSVPGAAGWTQNVGTGGLLTVSGWGYLDLVNTDPQWAAAYGNAYDNQVKLQFDNAFYTFGTPYGYYNFDCTLTPASHQESIGTYDVPALAGSVVSLPQSEIEGTFTTAVSGGGTAILRGWTVNEVLTSPGGTYPIAIQDKADKYWQLSSTLTSFQTDLTFNIADQHWGNATAWRVLRRPFYSTQWAIYPNIDVSQASSGIIKALGVTAFSEWTVASEDRTLPVELSSFTAAMESQDAVIVKWSTQSETELAGYRVYRGENQELNDATCVTTLIGAANTSTTHNYTYVDGRLTPGSYSYWLEAVDLNGATHFFGPVSTILTEPGTGAETPVLPGILTVTNYPNPFMQSTKISYFVPKGGDVKIDIINLKGQIVSTHVVKGLVPNTHEWNWDGRDNNENPVASGVYFCRVQSEQATAYTKLMLVK